MNYTEVEIESVECIGEFKDEYVYDIGMKKNHTFFANDILVHNSVYVVATQLFRAICKKLKINTEDDYDKIWTDDFIAKFCKLIDNKVVPKVNNACKELMLEKFNSPRGDRIEFKREKLNSEAMFFAKKRYMTHTRDDEGVPVNKFSYTGIDVKKNELPTKIKNELSTILEDFLTTRFSYSEYESRIAKIWDKYINMTLDEIAYIKGYNTEKKVLDFLKYEKGAGAHVRSSLAYNQLLKKMKLNAKYEDIKVGDKVRFVYTKKTNIYGLDVIAYKDKYPVEFEDIFEINRKKMFNKTVLKPLNAFEKLLNWQTPNPNIEIALDIMTL